MTNMILDCYKCEKVVTESIDLRITHPFKVICEECHDDLSLINELRKLKDEGWLRWLGFCPPTEKEKEIYDFVEVGTIVYFKVKLIANRYHD